jgi:hypothetical protein
VRNIGAIYWCDFVLHQMISAVENHFVSIS